MAEYIDAFERKTQNTKTSIPVSDTPTPVTDKIITDFNQLSDSGKRVITANAVSQGITPEEYLKKRGGVEATTGKYGDSYDPTKDLTAAEYNAVKDEIATKGLTGAAVGQAFNEALAKKRGISLTELLNGSTKISSSSSGGLKSSSQMATESASAARQADRQSAYDLLYSEFAQYGLGSLVEPLKGLIVSGASPAEFTIKLRESEPYKKRFAGNAQRIAKGLTAINEATYLATEDKYQALMRNYGLPQSYWAKDSMGTQEGFTNLIGNDVSAVELEDRIMTAQNRVINANPEVANALKSFYPDITNGDILAYALNPQQGLSDIKRKVTAAEIGGAALQSGLSTDLARAEELGRYGIDKATAVQGFTAIGSGLQRGSQLASIYSESPYTQTTAEAEVFNVPGAAEARKQRQKITGLEKATFGGQTGISQGALARDRAGAY